MITDIIYTYPTPSLNIGGEDVKLTAKIRFSIDIDDNSLIYETIKIEGLDSSNMTLKDLMFISDCVKEITILNGSNLKEIA